MTEDHKDDVPPVQPVEVAPTLLSKLSAQELMVLMLLHNGAPPPGAEGTAWRVVASLLIALLDRVAA